MKLVSKLLAKRIENTLVRSGLIPRTLFAYLKNKSIQEVVRSIRDVIENSSIRKDGKWAAVIQSDFSAAFDRVSREHIFNILRQLGFHEATVNMIKSLYQGAQCRILINDSVTPTFPITAGTPQGCALSGMLYNIAIQPLIVRLNLLTEKGVVSPYSYPF